MKRILLICMIVGLCTLVAVGGNIALVNSNGIIKKQREMVVEDTVYHIMVDVADKRLFLLKNDETLKSYPISVGGTKNPSPEGSWKATKKYKQNKDGNVYWFELDVPWGRYALHSTTYKNKNNFDVGSIKLFQDDLLELYNLVEEEEEATVYIYNDQDDKMVFMSLEPGSKGSRIYEIEKRLRSNGYYVGKVDGIYDKDLEEAVHKFQKANKLVESDKIDYAFYMKLGMMVLE